MRRLTQNGLTIAEYQKKIQVRKPKVIIQRVPSNQGVVFFNVGGDLKFKGPTALLLITLANE